MKSTVNKLENLKLSFGGKPEKGKFIRPATPEDASQIHAIYAPFVKTSYATYEYVIPTVEDMAGRIQKTMETYPYLVYEKDGEILGYAYACKHRERIGYQFCVETAIYIAENGRRSGIGKILYETLFEILTLQGFYCAVAWINIPNDASVNFHSVTGFTVCGSYRVAVKFAHWTDTLIMHKFLKEMVDGVQPETPIPFPKLIQCDNNGYE